LGEHHRLRPLPLQVPDWPRRGCRGSRFAPRKAATTIYLTDGVRRYSEQLEQLGPHTTGVGCLYIKDLETVDLSVLETIVAESYRTVTDGT
jgi:hypothetical protein